MPPHCDRQKVWPSEDQVRMILRTPQERQGGLSAFGPGAAGGTETGRGLLHSEAVSPYFLPWKASDDCQPLESCCDSEQRGPNCADLRTGQIGALQLIV